MIQREPVLCRNTHAFPVSEGTGHFSKVGVLNHAKL